MHTKWRGQNKIQELVYNRPSLIRSQVGSVSTFGCKLQFHICFFFPLNLRVYSVQCRQKVKLNNASALSSITMIMCVFSSVDTYLCAYVCSCVCSPRGTYLCHCQYVQAGSGGQLCACVQKALDALQTSAGNCNGPCPVQKMARVSHLQAKWPYPEDVNLHLGQQQHEQQGDETGY